MELRIRPRFGREHAAHAGVPVEPALRTLRRVSAVGVMAYVLLLSGAGLGVAGASTLLLGGGYSFFLALLVVIILARAVLYRQDRAAWGCFAAALACYLGGNAGYALHYQHHLTSVRPFWPDLGWMAFYPLAYVALVLMLRNRVRRLAVGTWVDGVVTGLTAAAFGAAFAVGAVLDATEGSLAVVATSLAYPIGDTLLLILVLASITVIGRGAGAAWWWLSAGMALFALTDVVYVLRVAQGTFASGTLLDLGWGAAFLSFGMAALQPPRTGTAARLEGRDGLVLPGLCALSALALLFAGYLHNGDLVAGGLALAAVLAALGRGTLTFREVRALADSRRQARTDELTGLPNRRSVYEALAAADLDLAQGRGLALLVIDLDRFKEINDSLGHVAGDELLRQVGPRLSDRLRPGDLLARLGGDEFVVLARDTSAAEALLLAQRLRAELQRPFRFGSMGLTVDASVGIAVGPGHSVSAEELLQLADLAMYSAKSGRLGAALFDDARDGEGRHRLETVEQLRAGIAGGELVLHYQPKLDLRTGAVDGVEALVRWAHPERGLLYPDSFIDLAENSGLMPQLTAAVLDQALAQCRSWADTGIVLDVSVNISPTDLVDDDFPAQVAAGLHRHRLPPTRLVLEVTESLLMADRERAVRVLERLRSTGVGISIDDYGTGYSSLAYLASLPVTELKLDRAFVGSMNGSPRAAVVVTSTLQLARSLGLVLVAEGVEDAATVAALSALDCDLVQGYHVSRPLPPGQLAGWLTDRSPADRPVPVG
jgi:diguanylate cyclase (GGDEF)-like protein